MSMKCLDSICTTAFYGLGILVVCLVENNSLVYTITNSKLFSVCIG